MQYANLDKQGQPQTVKAPAQVKNPSKLRRAVFFIILFLAIFGLYNFAPLLLRAAKVAIVSPKIVYSVVANKEPDLEQYKGRTNILLLGTGGGEHDGPDLTDTIILASIDVKTGDTLLVSFPRDVYIPDTKSKINAIYTFQKEKNEATGLATTKDIFSKYLGIPIAYAVRIDFAGFQKAIDVVGGIDVMVENTFDDYYYPILNHEYDTCGYVEGFEEVAATPAPVQVTASASAQPSNSPLSSPLASLGTAKRLYYYNAATGKKIYADQVSEQNNPYACRFEHIHYEKGLMHIDGLTALKFVRSRHANGQEGSDFARSKRQQLVIQALRTQLTAKETLLDLGKIQGLVNTFGDSIEMTIPESKYGDFYLLYKRVKQAAIRSLALTDGSAGEAAVFYNPPMADYGGAWVLVPIGNDWFNVQKRIEDAMVIPTPTPAPSLSPSVSVSPSSKPKK